MRGGSRQGTEPIQGQIGPLKKTGIYENFTDTRFFTGIRMVLSTVFFTSKIYLSF